MHELVPRLVQCTSQVIMKTSLDIGTWTVLTCTPMKILKQIQYLCNTHRIHLLIGIKLTWIKSGQYQISSLGKLRPQVLYCTKG